MLTKTAIATSILLLTGCATLLEGTTQNFTVSTMSDKRPEQTLCHITNEEGSWQVLANSNTQIHRDGNAVIVECNNEIQSGMTSFEPEFNGGYFITDLLFTACAGLLIDGVENSLYSYPTTAIVGMHNKFPAHPKQHPKPVETLPPRVLAPEVIQPAPTTTLPEYSKDRKGHCFIHDEHGNTQRILKSYCH